MTTAKYPRIGYAAAMPWCAKRWLISGDLRDYWPCVIRGVFELNEQRVFWEQHADAVVAWHVRHWPGTRPDRWWEFSAPELPRRRLGGTGTPLHECSAVGALYDRGIPAGWRRADDLVSLATCPSCGKAWPTLCIATPCHGSKYMRDITAEDRAAWDGKPGRWPYGYALDPSDPPRFESEAAYLRRLKLLLPGEARRLRPRDFIPEAVT
jgi:hypothetical protein